MKSLICSPVPCYMIEWLSETWCCDFHGHINYLTLICLHLTPVLDMLLLTWHLRSDTGTWHVITWHLILNTWYLTPVFDMLLLDTTWHLISSTGTWHVTLDTWYLTLDIWHRYLTCYHLTPNTWLLIYDTWWLTCYHLLEHTITWY